MLRGVGRGPVCLPPRACACLLHLSCSEVDSDGAALARARLVAGTAGQCFSLAIALWAAWPSCSLTKRRPSVLSSDRVSVYMCEALGLKSAARATGEAKCSAGALGPSCLAEETRGAWRSLGAVAFIEREGIAG